MDDAALLFGLAAFVSSVSLLVHVGVGARRRWRDTERADQERRAAEVGRVVGALRQQLDRIERAVEAQSVDVERLAEAQRFAARLLAGRGGEEGRAPEPPSGPRVPARVTTPH